MKSRIRTLVSVMCALGGSVLAAACDHQLTQPVQSVQQAATRTLSRHDWMYTDAAPGTTLTTRVILRDGAGNPVPGVRVRWTVLEGGGSFARTFSRTNAEGIAQQQWTMGPPGPQSARASAPGASAVRFEANSVVGSIVLDTIVSGLTQPIYLTAPPGDSRLFVVEEIGRIRVVENGTLLTTPFLDLRSIVFVSGERGLLSMAFHPNYATNGFFFVNYTDLNGDTRVVRYHATPGSNTADPSLAKLILHIVQPADNHNGGHLMFGPDGMLYIPMGDGGGANDPQGNGQNLETLLGKLLRIDVDVLKPYGVPRGNPYFGHPTNRPEIWALGLRNPWRIAIDNGLIYIADVGQTAREEVNVAALDQRPLNYGWKIMEGSICRPSTTCSTAGLRLPLFDYTHADGCAVTGGFVYRGSELPEIVGTYFYADYCGGWIRSFRYQNGQATQQRQWNQLVNVANPASFGVDGFGELYILSRPGHVLRFTRN